MKDLKKLAEELGLAIEESEEFKAYQRVKDIYDTDESLQELIKEFNLKKMAVMQQMQNKTKDDAKLSELQDEMRAAYSAVMAHPVMDEYNDAKDKLENVVNEIYGIINYHVTGQEPGCSGSCSTCGGCH